MVEKILEENQRKIEEAQKKLVMLPFTMSDVRVDSCWF